VIETGLLYLMMSLAFLGAFLALGTFSRLPA